MDKQSKAPGVYRVILCVLTLALAPVFYAIWQPYNTCLLQLPAAGGAWQLLTRLLYYVLFSLLLAGICRSSLGSKTVAPFGAKPWLRTVGGVLAARLVLDLVIYGGSFLLPVDLVRQIGQLAFLLFAFWWAARCAGLTAAVDRGGRVWVALMGVLTGGVWLALLLYGRGVTAAYENRRFGWCRIWLPVCCFTVCFAPAFLYGGATGRPAFRVFAYLPCALGRCYSLPFCCALPR